MPPTQTTRVNDRQLHFPLGVLTSSGGTDQKSQPLRAYDARERAPRRADHFGGSARVLRVVGSPGARP